MRFCHLPKPSTGDQTSNLKPFQSHRWGVELAELLQFSLPPLLPLPATWPVTPMTEDVVNRKVHSCPNPNEKSVSFTFPIIKIPNLIQKLCMWNYNAINGLSLTDTQTKWFYLLGRGSQTVILWYLGIGVPVLILNTYVPNPRLPPPAKKAQKKYHVIGLKSKNKSLSLFFVASL